MSVILAVLVMSLSACQSKVPYSEKAFQAQMQALAQLASDRASLGAVSGALEPGDSIELAFFRTSRPSEQLYRILPGDRLQLDVNGHPHLSRDNIIVLPDGMISIPLVGLVRASGRDLFELTNSIVEAYKDHKIHNPQVSVSIMETNDPIVKLTEATLAAQSTESSPHRYYYDGAPEISLPLLKPLNARVPFQILNQEIQRAYDELSQGGVSVTVRHIKGTPLSVYVIGEVIRPGPVNYSMQLHPLMAIANAGGYKTTAKLDEFHLYRISPEGKLLHYTLNAQGKMSHQTNTKRPDAPGLNVTELLPRDILFVPNTRIAGANKWVEQYIRNLIPVPIGVGFSYDLEH